MFPALIAEDGVAIDHSTGATYDRATSLAYLNSILRTRQLVRRLELLATLDDSLALCRMTATGADAAGDQHDIRAFESEHVILIQADPQGRREHLETFPAMTSCSRTVASARSCAAASRRGSRACDSCLPRRKRIAR